MGRRGPPPKPSAQKRAEGTYRPDRAARNEVIAPAAEPAVPKGLPKTARAKWRELVPILLERGTLSLEDGAILEAHVRAYAQWRRYQVMAETRPMVSTPWGDKVNPAAKEARVWETRVTQTGDRLGLNASARSRVGTQDGAAKAEDPDDAFLDGKRPLSVVKGGLGA